MRLAFVLALVFAPYAAADDLTDAEKAYQNGEYAKAAELAVKAAAADPKNPEPHFLAGMAYSTLREQAKAAEQFTAVLKLDPKLAAAHDKRGDAYLKLGRWKEAVADFDKFLEVNPKFLPEHWRRGIALYYAGEHKKGVEQFETHKMANPQDVENAAWHYLCNVKVVGKEKSVAALIDVTRDSRVPMAEIQKLFAGKLKPEDVLAKAEKTKDGTPEGISARFYANLYVALWYEAEGDAKKVTQHLTAAVEKYKVRDYMWDVGNAHLGMLKAKK